MTDTPIVFDQAALKQRITDSVQASFGMLIPAEQFKAMVDKEVKAYFEEDIGFRVESVASGWGRDSHHDLVARMTSFRRAVFDAVSAQVKVLLEKELNGDRFRAIVAGQYGGGEAAELSTMLTAKLDDIAPKMASTMFRDLFAGAVCQAKADIQHLISERLGH